MNHLSRKRVCEQKGFMQTSVLFTLDPMDSFTDGIGEVVSVKFDFISSSPFKVLTSRNQSE